MSYAFPETGLCFDSGAWAWLNCSFRRPGFTAFRGAAKGDIFELVFVAYGIRDGVLGEEMAEEGWNSCVGNAYNAYRKASTSFRYAINGRFRSDEDE